MNTQVMNIVLKNIMHIILVICVHNNESIIWYFIEMVDGGSIIGYTLSKEKWSIGSNLKREKKKMGIIKRE